MYYPKEVVEEVRARNDIVDVISSYVSLKRKGNSYFGFALQADLLLLWLRRRRRRHPLRDGI